MEEHTHLDSIPTGWLYLAGVMDLCGQKIVGVSMDARMTKELVMNESEDAKPFRQNKGLNTSI